jgi:hypothetical protein
MVECLSSSTEIIGCSKLHGTILMAYPRQAKHSYSYNLMTSTSIYPPVLQSVTFGRARIWVEENTNGNNYIDKHAERSFKVIALLVP